MFVGEFKFKFRDGCLVGNCAATRLVKPPFKLAAISLIKTFELSLFELFGISFTKLFVLNVLAL